METTGEKIQEVAPVEADISIRGVVSRLLQAVRKINHGHPVLINMCPVLYDQFVSEVAEATGKAKEELKVTSLFGIPLKIRENAPLGMISVMTQKDGAYTNVPVKQAVVPKIVTPRGNRILGVFKRG